MAKKTREQPAGQEILGKLNSLVEDILIKNAVDNALASPASSHPMQLPASPPGLA